MKTVGFYTLGCKLNFSETSTLARQFADQNFARVEFNEPADVYVVNTCSVTENADKKCKKIVKQALKQNPDAYVIIVGCYAQLKPQEIAQIPGVDAVLGAAEKFRLFELLNDFEKTHQTQVHRCQIEGTRDFVPTFSQEERTRAFLKVQDGCDYKCSFCTIPLARGASRSDLPQNVLQNARQLTQAGVNEIVLTGINIGDYGVGLKESFLDLIQLLDAELTELPRIRISSIEPNLLSDEIIEFVAGSKRFMPHFHVPLQSGSNEILGKMRRRYRRELYAERVEKIKTALPHACIGCDVIVGFPGETDAHFDETYRFLADLDVSYLHVFSFSERANTLAAEMPGSVPLAVREERSRALRQLSEKKRRYFYEQFVGQTRPVLVEHEQNSGLRHGFTDNYIKVVFPENDAAPNQITPFFLENVNADGEMAAKTLALVV